MTAKAGEEFLKNGKPVAKKKVKITKKKRQEPVQEVRHGIGGDALRGVMQETMCRVYEEMFPGHEFRDGGDNPDLEIQEETYILGLTMVAGRDDYAPRRGLKIKEAEISGTLAYCRDHRP